MCFSELISKYSDKLPTNIGRRRWSNGQSDYLQIVMSLVQFSSNENFLFSSRKNIFAKLCKKSQHESQEMQATKNYNDAIVRDRYQIQVNTGGQKIYVYI